jgi:hypothetical protein
LSVYTEVSKSIPKLYKWEKWGYNMGYLLLRGWQKGGFSYYGGFFESLSDFEKVLIAEAGNKYVMRNHF